MTRKGKRKVVEEGDRVMSAEDRERMNENPQYHLILLHRTGHIVFRRCLTSAESIIKNTTFPLQEGIVEAMEEFENKRKPLPEIK